MTEAEQIKEKVDEQFQALRTLKKQKQLDIADFGKMAVLLATVLVDAKLIDEAIELLREVPSQYFTDIQLDQMLDNESYCEAAIKVAEAIEGSAKAKQTAEAKLFTMPRGQA